MLEVTSSVMADTMKVTVKDMVVEAMDMTMTKVVTMEETNMDTTVAMKEIMRVIIVKVEMREVIMASVITDLMMVMQVDPVFMDFILETMDLVITVPNMVNMQVAQASTDSISAIMVSVIMVVLMDMVITNARKSLTTSIIITTLRNTMWSSIVRPLSTIHLPRYTTGLL